MKKNILIAVLFIIIVLMGGTFFYLYTNKDNINKCNTKCPVTSKGEIEEREQKEETKSISSSYIYDGKYLSNPELNVHLEVKLNDDNTFILYESITDAMAFKGTYTLNNETLTLYSSEMDSSQEEQKNYEISSDTFDCIYNKNNNTITINKWNQHRYNKETKRVEYSTFTEFKDLKLSKNDSLEHIGKDRFQN